MKKKENLKSDPFLKSKNQSAILPSTKTEHKSTKTEKTDKKLPQKPELLISKSIPVERTNYPLFTRPVPIPIPKGPISFLLPAVPGITTLLPISPPLYPSSPSILPQPQYGPFIPPENNSPLQETNQSNFEPEKQRKLEVIDLSTLRLTRQTLTQQRGAETTTTEQEEQETKSLRPTRKNKSHDNYTWQQQQFLSLKK